MRPEISPARGVLDSPRMETDSPQYLRVREHHLFAGLDDDQFTELASRMSEIVLAKNEVLFHRGDEASAFYFIEKGHIELSLISPGGHKKTVEVVSPGRAFAEAIMFMRQSVYPVTAEALDDAVVYRIPNDGYLQVLQRDRDACMRLLSDLSKHLHARVKEIERLTIQNARSRLSTYLIDHIVEVDDDEATIRLDLPRHIIASRLSVTPETLSRLLRSLADEGIITSEDRVIFVHSLARLRPYD